MRTVRDHINKPVVTTSDGRKLGKIRDLFFDAKLTRGAAVYLGTSDVLGRKKLMIDRDKVRTVGTDAWLVDSADVVVAPGQIVGARYFAGQGGGHGGHERGPGSGGMTARFPMGGGAAGMK